MIALIVVAMIVCRGVLLELDTECKLSNYLGRPPGVDCNRCVWRWCVT